MKIAFIVDEFPSISQTFVLSQITGLVDMGHEVDIYAETAAKIDNLHNNIYKYGLLKRTYYLRVPRNKFKRLLKGLGYVIKYFPKNKSAVLNSLNICKYGRSALSLSLLFEIQPFLNNGPYDIVHCQFGTVGPRGVLLKQLRAINCKVITSIRGFDITKYLINNPGVYNELFRAGDLFLPVSNTLKERLIREGCDKNKIIVHHSGIDNGKYQYKERQWVKGDTVRVLTVARLVEKKGVAYAIQAVARLINNGIKISYDVVGDGILRSDLENLIKELGVESHIRIIGWKRQEEVVRLLQDVNVLIAPSITGLNGDQEGIPNVLKEAMSSGLPVISTHHSGIPELVMDGESGYLVPERDVNGLAQSLAYLIEHPEIWSEMGCHGRNIVEEEYDINKLNKRLVSIYQGLLN